MQTSVGVLLGYAHHQTKICLYKLILRSLHHFTSVGYFLRPRLDVIGVVFELEFKRLEFLVRNLYLANLVLDRVCRHSEMFFDLPSLLHNSQTPSHTSQLSVAADTKLSLDSVLFADILPDLS